MKNLIIKIKELFGKFISFFKNPSFIIPEFVIILLFFSCTTIVATIADNKYSSEIAYSITAEAENSKYKYGVNTIQMKQQGNSDYFIYSNNDLQNFQMRNQQETNEKSYIFAAYSPYGSYSAFSFKDVNTGKLVKCTTILNESKYTGSSFYFDLPLLAGAFNRNITKDTLIVSQKIADKMLEPSKNYTDLIGTNINGYVEASYATTISPYKIGAVVDTDNNLGQFLESIFGENIVFTCEYNSYRMDGKIYFCPSSQNLQENKMISDFVLNKYVETNSNSRDLQIGYKPEFTFCRYDEQTNSYIKSAKNDSLNKYINFYTNKQNSVLLIVFVAIDVILLAMNIMLVLKNKDYLLKQGIGISVFGFWFIAIISILINSILFKFNIFSQILIHVKPSTNSNVVSTVLFLSWMFIALIDTVLIGTVKSITAKKNCN